MIGIDENIATLKKTFGKLKHLKRSTKRMLKEVDEELWND